MSENTEKSERSATIDKPEKLVVDPSRIKDPSEVFIDNAPQETVRTLYGLMCQQYGTSWRSDILLPRGVDLYYVEVKDLKVTGSLTKMTNIAEQSTAQVMTLTQRDGVWRFYFRSDITPSEFVGNIEDNKLLDTLRQQAESMKIVYDQPSHMRLSGVQECCMREFVVLLYRELILDTSVVQFSIGAVYGINSFTVRMVYTDTINVVSLLRLVLDSFSYEAFAVADVHLAHSYKGFVFHMKRDGKRKREEHYDSRKK